MWWRGEKLQIPFVDSFIDWWDDMSKKDCYQPHLLNMQNKAVNFEEKSSRRGRGKAIVLATHPTPHKTKVPVGYMVVLALSLFHFGKDYQAVPSSVRALLHCCYTHSAVAAGLQAW